MGLHGGVNPVGPEGETNEGADGSTRWSPCPEILFGFGCQNLNSTDAIPVLCVGESR
ncbi:hypothetical protein B2J93_6078 [Marssonina coronariae]|uniref:Uncharacterized protein n=1 Tax=Diplocarpon coronariae TaxID=2795749 RepID=A0A218Z8Z7_9HELO|nr:hypothetical protein B2J93_6078 [Marssonina coronariae]